MLASVRRPAPWRWRQLVPSGELPAARSSHLCVNWSTEGALVVHGGLGNDGVTGDVWMLRRGDGGNGVSGGECAWARVITSGGDVNWYLFSPVIYVSRPAVVLWCREVLQKLVFDQIPHFT